MNYSRPMIDLVYEIRRRVPSDLKPNIKLANPDLLTELAALVSHNTKDIILHALVRELLTLAGDEWLTQLDPELDAEQSSHAITKMYRGSTQLEAETATKVEHEAPAQDAKPNARPVRIYRGQIIED